MHTGRVREYASRLLRNGLRPYQNEPLTPSTIESMRATLNRLINELKAQGIIDAGISVTVAKSDDNPNSVTVTFSDPRMGLLFIE